MPEPVEPARTQAQELGVTETQGWASPIPPSGNVEPAQTRAQADSTNLSAGQRSSPLEPACLAQSATALLPLLPETFEPARTRAYELGATDSTIRKRRAARTQAQEVLTSLTMGASSGRRV
ncbi:MAG: hypothetical protein LBU38_07205 [Propionibacteriaceae bacterium]|nr:hypothetical protein [Propionibacteriaceae bacterium]